MNTPPPVVVQLVHIYGPLKGQIQEFCQDVITIGRHPSSSLRFPAELVSISRNHAHITREGSRFKLVDHSKNGTILNGKEVKEAFLKEGDVIEFTLGGPKISFLTVEEEVGRPPRHPAPPHASPGAAGPGVAAAEKADELQGEDLRPEMASLEPEPPPGVVEKVTVSLVIQYGPTIRTFHQVPVTVGKSKRCDFVIDLPQLVDLHARIFYSKGRYWIKDLTGQSMIRINTLPIQFDAPLNPQDRVSLTPQGPTFSFIGEGRLAEVTELALDASPMPEEAPNEGGHDQSQKDSRGLWSKLKKEL